MQGTGECADVVRLCGRAITAGLEGLTRTQGAGGRADVVCGRAITTISATSIRWAMGPADEGHRRGAHAEIAGMRCSPINGTRHLRPQSDDD
jgi:hypothetical protein